MHLAAANPQPRLIVTTASSPLQPAQLVSTSDTGISSGFLIEIDPAAIRQSVAGFGGCFNEKGWETLGLLSETDRTAVLCALFDPQSGCRFNLGRMPMGANDYSLAWYSFDETAADYSLEHFNIERDRQYLIPYLRAALRLNPALRVWASPWCPPSWMKTNGHYAGLPAPVNDLRPDQAGAEMVTQFRMEPRVLDAYARYFGRFLDAYREEGIEVSAVHVQNEPNSCQNFPSCVWRPEDLATFIGKYLGPLFRKQGRSTEIWLGTIERPQLERVSAVLDSPSGQFITGVGFQWAGKNAIPEVARRYPSMRLMQTETECGNGSNDWAAAEHTWTLLHHYFRYGAEAYMYWNMVLDETGNSRWGWRQNAMITVDRGSRSVRYNPEFYLMYHFSHFVTPGAKRLQLAGDETPAVAFLNPDGSIVVVAANLGDQARRFGVKVRAATFSAQMPARSFATAIIPPMQTVR
ncbi:MAG: glycoside hydrolase family 30 beta sandwich domain-containing protein [Opitutaceae bacterium]|jgi:glucosylceramidase